MVNGVEVVIRGKRDDDGEYLAPSGKFLIYLSVDGS
jgi:hypothetical protein